ncbi:MAG: hypothetical protein AB2A00_16710 [Myxococcota bacterium]
MGLLVERPLLTRLPLLLLAAACLVSGLWAGLARAGIPTSPPALMTALHGALMVPGFFAALISLERAVAVGLRWAYLAPLLAAVGCLSAALGAPATVALFLVGGASAVLTAASTVALRRMPELFTGVMLAGASALVGGNLVWLLTGAPTPATLLWMAFLVLTIAAERLELSRLQPRTRGAERLFLVAVALVFTGAVMHVVAADAGARLVGVGLLATSWWLVRHDLARRTVRLSGLPRYTAVCLLSGYAWLFLGGVMLLATGLPPAGLLRDATLHAVFLGFVMPMVFGHAPIILPAILQVAVPFHRALHLPLVVLHLSVAARVGADLAGHPGARTVASVANVAALGLFVVTVLVSRRVQAARPVNPVDAWRPGAGAARG